MLRTRQGIQLTPRQTFFYFSWVGVLPLTGLALALYLFQGRNSHSGIGSIGILQVIKIFIPFIFLAVLGFAYRRDSLRFKKVPLSLNENEFLHLIETVKNSQRWSLVQQTVDGVKFETLPSWRSLGEIVTIKRGKNVLFFNSISNPSGFISLDLFGVNKDNFIRFQEIIVDEH